MRLQLATAAAFIGLIASQIHAAQAVDIYSNLGTPDSSSNAAIGYNSVANFDVTYAQGFTTGASLYLLDSVDLPLGVTGAGNGSPKLQIYSNNAGTPGTDLGVTFTNPTFGAQSLYNFSLATPFALSASTSYWMVLSDTTAGTQTKFNWYYTDTFSSPTAKNGSGVSFLGGARSNNGGALWSTNNGFAQTGITLNATAVPEPTTYALAAIATGVMAIVARRRKARKVDCI
jgi:hypothetical protein